MKQKKYGILNGLFDVACIVVFVITAFLLTQSFIIAKVNGNSMFPTLADGDILIVSALETSPSNNEVVIVDTKNTIIDSDYIIKRYYSDKSTTGLWLEGDNASLSFDSRFVGEFDSSSYIGTAIFNVSTFSTVK